MKARIHRGAAEIGGNCVELEAQGKRLVLDVGRPLTADWNEEVPLPEVEGLHEGGDPALLGVLLSHPHPDHYGLVDQVHSDVPIFIGEAAERILREAAFFSPTGSIAIAAGHLADRVSLELGPFRVTPFLVDHSAFDSYALLVEADGRRLFYSGDLRSHGRKPQTFERLIRTPPRGVNVALLEGTRIGRDTGDEPTDESEVERRCIEVSKQTQGMVLACYSPQNIDRLVTVYRAALQADRDLVVDLYTAAVAAATGLDSIPQADWERVRVYVPQRQRVQVKRAGEFARIEAIKGSRIYAEEIASRPEHYVMTFRHSMTSELERAGCLQGASALWLMWPGYLELPRGLELRDDLRRMEIDLSTAHASGHATIADLRRLSDAIDADRIVPIHTSAPERFPEFFERVEPYRDGEWWEV